MKLRFLYICVSIHSLNGLYLRVFLNFLQYFKTIRKIYFTDLPISYFEIFKQFPGKFIEWEGGDAIVKKQIYVLENIFLF